MIVKIVETGKAMEVNACYAARLIEQGKATACRSADAEEKPGTVKNGGKKAGLGNGTDR